MEKKKKKKKVNFKRLKRFLVFLIIVIGGLVYYFNYRVKNIIITGNDLISDVEIIEMADLKNYPKMVKVNKRKIEKVLQNNPLIASVKIEKTITGKVKLKISEKKVLVYDRAKNKLCLSDGSQVDYNANVYGLPLLINYVPDTIYNDFISGLLSVNKDILSSISEIEYSPSRNNNGETLDETRFKLTMNDGNVVFVNIVNIERLNKYFEIYARLSDAKGMIQLDSSNENNVYVEPFIKEEETNENED